MDFVLRVSVMLACEQALSGMGVRNGENGGSSLFIFPSFAPPPPRELAAVRNVTTPYQWWPQNFLGEGLQYKEGGKLRGKGVGQSEMKIMFTNENKKREVFGHNLV